MAAAFLRPGVNAGGPGGGHACMAIVVSPRELLQLVQRVDALFARLGLSAAALPAGSPPIELPRALFGQSHGQSFASDPRHVTQHAAIAGNLVAEGLLPAAAGWALRGWGTAEAASSALAYSDAEYVAAAEAERRAAARQQRGRPGRKSARRRGGGGGGGGEGSAAAADEHTWSRAETDELFELVRTAEGSGGDTAGGGGSGVGGAVEQWCLRHEQLGLPAGAVRARYHTFGARLQRARSLATPAAPSCSAAAPAGAPKPEPEPELELVAGGRPVRGVDVTLSTPDGSLFGGSLRVQVEVGT